MNRHDLQLLQQVQGYPALTITLPTYRTSPDNRRDPIRVKNLADQATNRLLAEFGKRDLTALLKGLNELVASLDYSRMEEGLALFVNHDMARAVTIPFRLEERVILDDNFYTRDIVYALNRTPRYWLLTLNEKATRLFECTRESAEEIRTEGFPLTHTGAGGATAVAAGPAGRSSAHRDERHRQFFRDVSAALKPFMDDDPLPIALIGVDRYLSFFREVSSYRAQVVAAVAGSHENTKAHELGRLAWPAVKAALAQKREAELVQLEKAVSERRAAFDINEIWQAAHEGRGRLLFVEEDFHYPARLDESGTRLLAADDPTAPDVMDDAVDEIIEEVLRLKGDVIFTDSGKLGPHHGMALSLRY
jgi:hypothetical protein